jgi:hypothetical protein
MLSEKVYSLDVSDLANIISKNKDWNGDLDFYSRASSLIPSVQRRFFFLIETIKQSHKHAMDEEQLIDRVQKTIKEIKF